MQSQHSGIHRSSTTWSSRDILIFNWDECLFGQKSLNPKQKILSSCHTFDVCVMLSHSVVSNSLWPHRLESARFLWPWGFSRQEYWSGLLCPPPGDLPNPGIKPRSPTLQVDFFNHLSPQGSPRILVWLAYPFSPEDLSNLGIEPGSPALQAGSLPDELAIPLKANINKHLPTVAPFL